MAASETHALAAEARSIEGSRATRRLRRTGRVPGVVYGGGEEPLAFAVDAVELRHALHQGGAVLELTIDKGEAMPVVVKEQQRHPVRGQTTHLDLLRVRLDVEIEATVPLELVGIEDSPGVKEGGVLEQIARELTVLALPTSIPDVIVHDVSGMELHHTLLLEEIAAPQGARIVDEPDTVVATLTPPRIQVEPEEGVEEEAALVGEDGEPVEPADEDAGEAPAEDAGEE